MSVRTVILDWGLELTCSLPNLLRLGSSRTSHHLYLGRRDQAGE